MKSTGIRCICWIGIEFILLETWKMKEIQFSISAGSDAADRILCLPGYRPACQARSQVPNSSSVLLLAVPYFTAVSSCTTTTAERLDLTSTTARSAKGSISPQAVTWCVLPCVGAGLGVVHCTCCMYCVGYPRHLLGRRHLALHDPRLQQRGGDGVGTSSVIVSHQCSQASNPLLFSVLKECGIYAVNPECRKM